MRWAEHAACLGERKGAYMLLGNKPGGDNLKDLVVDGMIILKLFFKKRNWGVDVIDLAQNGNRWHTFLNTVVKFWVS
jgi:predicted RNA-binding protein with PUA domain